MRGQARGRGRSGPPSWAPVRCGCAGVVRWRRPAPPAEWLSLEGEPGVGKLALLPAVHRRRNPAGTFHVLDAAEAGDHDWMVRALGELLEGEGSLVIRHVDLLSTLRLQALWIALEQALAADRQHVLWVAITLSQGQAVGDVAGLLKFFSAAVELPPLRHHIEGPA